jgi:hypothetical protein
MERCAPINRNKPKNTMFTYKYKGNEFSISVEYYHGNATYKTDYKGETIKQTYIYYSEDQAKKEFRKLLRFIINSTL